MSTRGQRLVEAMEKRKMQKQLALAYSLGVNESTVTRWKNDGPMSIDNAISVCRYLDVSLDWFLIGDGNIDQHKPSLTQYDNGDDKLVASFHRLAQRMNETAKAPLLNFFDSFPEI